MKNICIRAAPTFVLCAALTEHMLLPNKQVPFTTRTYPYVLIAGIVISVALFVSSLLNKKFGDAFRHKAPFFAAAFAFFILWDMTTLKFAWLRLPYFPGPDKVFYGFRSDWQLLLKCAGYSLRLLLLGYLFGGTVGLISGTLIGWSRRCNYWVGPLIKIIGPIPATAWMPIALVVFPSSFWASVFLISLAVWFPVTVMTSSGIANVRNAYFDVAKTLGGSKRYMIFNVAIPAAMPNIFIGLFMGMGASFLTLIAAEMLGVKAGLGWYIQWAQGWAEYSKVYTTLIVVAILFSGIITLLFNIKDRLLDWQKGLIKW